MSQYNSNTREYDNSPEGMANRAIAYAKKDLTTVKLLLEALNIEVDANTLVFELRKVKLTQVRDAVAARAERLEEEGGGVSELLASMS